MVFLYSLVRYRSSNNKTFNSFDKFESSKEFYELAHRVDPSDGSIYNQLAVIESLSPSKSVPMMIYLYSRALGSLEPFHIAKENLSKLLKKFGSLFGPLLKIIESDPGCIDSISADDLKTMLQNYPNEEHLLYGSALALGSFFDCSIPPILEINSLSIFSKLDTANPIDTVFLSSLIGCTFIKEDLQVEILALFKNSSGKFKISSQHDPIVLPLSQ